ncbi:MAG: extracellular solute-binding protein [Gammaproteobacteria bacterium]
MRVPSVFLLVLSIGFSVISSANDDKELIVYSGRSDKFVKPVVEAFAKETGIKVVLHSAKSTALLNKLKIEGERTPADLFLSNDAGNLQLGSELGLFQPVSSSTAGHIANNLRAPDNQWIGLSGRARVLVVNKHSKIANSIDSVFDLADPRLKGRLGITNSTNESFIAGVTVYMEAVGVDKTQAWLEGIKENANGQVFAKHSKIVASVANGKNDIGLVNHYYIYRHLAAHPDAPIKIVMPDQGDKDIGIAMNVAGIAITKHTKKYALAERFVDFLVSETGQKLFAEVNREYPAREGVAAAPEVPQPGTFKVSTVPMSALGKQRNATIDLIEKVGML